MEVSIKYCLEGAKKSEGIAVIMDIFRASNTIISILGSGAEKIIVTESLSSAQYQKKKNPDYVLFGERNGLVPKGVVHGNSPAKASKMNLSGKTAILTTSAGTKGIVNSHLSADEVLVASFANAKAVAGYIKKKNPKKISLIAIGLKARKKAIEDTLCAEYIKTLLEGRVPNFISMKKEILQGDGAQRLRNLHQGEDLNLSLKINSSNIVPKVYRKDALYFVKKV